MSDKYLRLTEPPALNYHAPECDACDIEVEHDGDDWLCPFCGTKWPGDGLEADADEATLYPDWSGDALTGPICPNELAWRVATLWWHDPTYRDKRLRTLLAERGEGQA